MTVLVRSILLAGSAPIAKSFADSFHRANTSNNSLGPNWVFMSPYGSSQILSTQCNVVGNVLQFQDTTASQNQTNPEMWAPVPTMTGLFGVSPQFSQFTWRSGNSSAGTRALIIGPAVLCGWQSTGFIGWNLQILDAGGSITNFTLLRWNNNTPTAIASTFGGPGASGDVIKLSGTVTGNNVVLKVYQNGTLINTVNDNAALSNGALGVPCIGRSLWSSGVAPGTGQQTLDNFSCGVGA